MKFFYNTFFSLLFLILLFSWTGCDKVKLGSGEGSGLVKRVDTTNQMITLDHGQVGKLMQPMLMSYAVTSPTMLKSVKDGDSAVFTLSEKTPGNIVITAIRKK